MCEAERFPSKIEYLNINIHTTFCVVCYVGWRSIAVILQCYCQSPYLNLVDQTEPEKTKRRLHHVPFLPLGNIMLYV